MALIEIIGDDNHVLINDSYKNIILANRGRVTFAKFDSSASTLGGYAEYSFTLSEGYTPVLAMRSGFSVATDTVTVANGIIRWRFLCEAAGIGGQMDVFIFYLPSTVQDAGGLVQLFNAQGELVFDSNLRYAKMEQQINYRFETGLSAQLRPGRTYAIAQTLTPREYSDLPVDAGGPGGFRMNRIAKYTGVYLDGITARARTFEYSNLSYRSPSPVGAYNENYEGSMLVFDMTTLEY